MSEDASALVEGLSMFATVLQEIKDASIDIMRVHPVNGLLMMNLLGNIGYAIFAVPTEEGEYMMGQWGLAGEHGSVRFSSRQELMSYIFRRTGSHAGILLTSEALGDLFQVFNVGKVLEVLK